MQPRQHKQDTNKHRCDRCRQTVASVTECEFAFRSPLRYWKPLWEGLKHKRLTRRRAQRMGEEWGFDWKHPPTYWMDLCSSCWEECSKPWDGFPMIFWEQVLSRGSALGEVLVPAKSPSPAV